MLRELTTAFLVAYKTVMINELSSSPDVEEMLEATEKIQSIIEEIEHLPPQMAKEFVVQFSTGEKAIKLQVNLTVHNVDKPPTSRE